MATSTASPISYASSAELAGAVVDRQNHGVVALDSNGIILLWNNWMQAWTGINSDQVIGKKFLNLFPSLHGSTYAKTIARIDARSQSLTWFLDSEPELIDSIESALASGYRTLPLSRIAISPFTLPTHSGTLLEFSEAPFNTLLASSPSTKLAADGLARDSRQLPTEAFTATLQTEAFGIISTDAQGLISALNPCFTKISGYQQEQLIGKELSLLFPGLKDCDDIRLNLEQTSRLHPDNTCEALDCNGKTLFLKVF